MMGRRCCLLPTSNKDEQNVLEKKERERGRSSRTACLFPFFPAEALCNQIFKWRSHTHTNSKLEQSSCEPQEACHVTTGYYHHWIIENRENRENRGG